MTNFDTTSGLSGGAILRLAVVQVSQNAGLNQSTDSWSLTLIKGAYSSFNLSGVTYSGSINGTPFSGSFTFDFRSTSSVLITSGSATVTHNSDGTKTIAVTGSIGSTATSTGGPAITSGAFAQTTIPPSIPTGAVVSRLSHTLTQPFESYALGTTEAVEFSAVAASTPQITLDTLPSDLSTSPVFLAASGSALDILNTTIRTEQGYLSCSTTGTLLAPVQKVTIRARQRPATVSYSFDAQTELGAQPEFLRDLTNLVAVVTSQGPTSSTTYRDPAASSRAGSSNTTDRVDLTASVDQTMYAEDRILRGKNTIIRVASFTVDALTTPTDRSADLLAMAFGDRVEITNIPATVTGFTTWDGWIIGRSEAHDIGQHKFTIFVAPVLPATAIYDTNRYMADGVLSLVSSLTTGATTMSVITNDGVTLLETVQVPYDLLIDTEQVTVTACTSAAPQVATITRSVNGVVATHATSATIEVTPASLYAF